MKIRLTLTYLLNLFDLYCTMRLVKLCGIGIEANPIGRWLIENHLAIPFKTIGIGAAFVALYHGITRYHKLAWTSWLVLAVYSILAICHIVLLQRTA